MTGELEYSVEKPGKVLSMHPQKFALWLFMASVMMMFFAFTSAYIVRQSEGDWLEFDLPSLFWVNSIIIILSSITMHWAYISAKKDNLERVKVAMGITTILGVAFLVGQVMAWNELISNDVYFSGSNPSASFVYVLTGVHGLHLVSGVIFLLIVLYATFKYKVHAKNMTRMEMCATYWHFLDGLWLYLFIFLLLNH